MHPRNAMMGYKAYTVCFIGDFVDVFVLTLKQLGWLLLMQRVELLLMTLSVCVIVQQLITVMTVCVIFKQLNWLTSTLGLDLTVMTVSSDRSGILSTTQIYIKWR